MSSLIQLADRCEQATGPDRDLDKDIALAQPERFFNAGPRYEGAPDRVGLIDTDGSRILPGNDPMMLVPTYTASIDAALALVPEGYDWLLGRTNDGLTIHAEVGGLGGEFMRFAATPAIALCAAALRARGQL